MSNEFKLNNNHISFIFDTKEDLNIFNLLRLIRDYIKTNEIVFNICSLSEHQQLQILSKFPNFLKIYNAIITSNKKSEVSVRHSSVNKQALQLLCENNDIIQDNDVLVFDVESFSSQGGIQNPHLVKNARGAVLLSLVQNLLSLSKINKSFTLFDERSPILLHTASLFLFNKENAKMAWDILISWEKQAGNNIEINRRISQSLKANDELLALSKECSKNSFDNSDFKFLFESLEHYFDLKSNINYSDKKINLWFIDDQHANGWSKLIKSFTADSLFNIESFATAEDVKKQLELIAGLTNPPTPDLAFVDLRLDSSDIGDQTYNAQDLSGFKVVDMLLEQWSGLSIMIASASSKLWNMEKAIEKGAVAYWRKSDEITIENPQSAILTAFDIHMTFIDKFSITLKKMKYKNIFKIVENIRCEAKLLNSSYNPLKLAIENYFNDLVQKTSWMCWRRESSLKINDSLYLGITEIYNELENFLWDSTTNKLKLVPDKNVQQRKDNSDKQIINNTLEYIDKKYELKGKALESYYEKNKGIRNKLPIIHGSEGNSDAKHAELLNIESSLLIAWCLIVELKRNES